MKVKNAIFCWFIGFGKKWIRCAFDELNAFNGVHVFRMPFLNVESFSINMTVLQLYICKNCPFLYLSWQFCDFLAKKRLFFVCKTLIV